MTCTAPRVPELPNSGGLLHAPRQRMTIRGPGRTTSWARMPVAIISQIGPGCGIIRAVSLRTVTDRIVGLGLTVGDGASDNGACREPTERPLRPCRRGRYGRTGDGTTRNNGIRDSSGDIAQSAAQGRIPPPASSPRRPASSALRRQEAPKSIRRPQDNRRRNNFPRLHLNTPVS